MIDQEKAATNEDGSERQQPTAEELANKDSVEPAEKPLKVTQRFEDGNDWELEFDDPENTDTKIVKYVNHSGTRYFAVGSAYCSAIDRSVSLWPLEEFIDRQVPPVAMIDKAYLRAQAAHLLVACQPEGVNPLGWQEVLRRKTGRSEKLQEVVAKEDAQAKAALEEDPAKAD